MKSFREYLSIIEGAQLVEPVVVEQIVEFEEPVEMFVVEVQDEPEYRSDFRNWINMIQENLNEAGDDDNSGSSTVDSGSNFDGGTDGAGRGSGSISPPSASTSSSFDGGTDGAGRGSGSITPPTSSGSTGGDSTSKAGGSTSGSNFGLNGPTSSASPANAAAKTIPTNVASSTPANNLASTSTDKPTGSAGASSVLPPARPAGLQSTPASGEYKVQAGDTLSSLSGRFSGDSSKAGYSALAKQNNISDPNKIQVGQVIKYGPQGGTAAPKPAGFDGGTDGAGRGSGKIAPVSTGAGGLNGNAGGAPTPKAEPGSPAGSGLSGGTKVSTPAAPGSPAGSGLSGGTTVAAKPSGPASSGLTAGLPSNQPAGSGLTTGIPGNSATAPVAPVSKSSAPVASGLSGGPAAPAPPRSDAPVSSGLTSGIPGNQATSGPNRAPADSGLSTTASRPDQSASGLPGSTGRPATATGSGASASGLNTPSTPAPDDQPARYQSGRVAMDRTRNSSDGKSILGF